METLRKDIDENTSPTHSVTAPEHLKVEVWRLRSSINPNLGLVTACHR